MLTKFPKDDASTRWTSHVKGKMAFYGLSEGRIRRVIKNPKRREGGIAPRTVAVMDRNDTPKRKEEIWVMYQEKSKIKDQKSKIQTENLALQNLVASLHKPGMTIISAWRYPGVSPLGKPIPIPEEIQAELDSAYEEADHAPQ